MEFRSNLARLLPTFKRTIERYFRGHGHPRHPLIDPLVDPSTQSEDNQDPLYCARRFVKLLSGISLLPPNGIKFSVCCFLMIA
jgi:hypothetical protein